MKKTTRPPWAGNRPFGLDPQGIETLPLACFDYDPKTQTLSTWESDLRVGPFDGRFPWLRPLRAGAAPVGIRVRSHRTGRVAEFVLERVEKNAGGDLVAFHLVPAPGELTKVRRVVVFND